LYLAVADELSLLSVATKHSLKLLRKGTGLSLQRQAAGSIEEQE